MFKSIKKSLSNVLYKTFIEPELRKEYPGAFAIKEKYKK